MQQILTFEKLDPEKICSFLVTLAAWLYGTSVCVFTMFVQTKMSQEILHSLPQNLTQTVIFPRE